MADGGYVMTPGGTNTDVAGIVVPVRTVVQNDQKVELSNSPELGQWVIALKGAEGKAC